MSIFTPEPSTEKIRPAEGGADSGAFGGATDEFNRPAAGTRLIPRTARAIVEEQTKSYFSELADDLPLPIEIEFDLLERTNNAFEEENYRRVDESRSRGRGGRPATIRPLQTLSHVQVALVLAHAHSVRRLISAERATALASDLDPVVIYNQASGVYLRSTDAISAAISLYSDQGERFEKNVLKALRVAAPSVRLVNGADWVAVANGDYNRRTGELAPFSPARAFLSRGSVAYVADAPNPIVNNAEDGTDWDIENWFRAIADNDEETYAQLWQLCAAVAQPNVRTNKAVALVNPLGNNGKGTFLALLKEIAGAANTVSASIANLAREQTLPALNGKSLILSDENATNDFVKNSETLKALITRDPVFVNPKYEHPYNLTFAGNQVHCLNALPRFADHSESMWRRWLLIPLLAKFEGKERKYIKDDYIRRPEVLQYVLRKALQMPFSGFSDSAAARDLLGKAKELNDPTLQFWAEHRDVFAWDLLPTELLYEMFKSWFYINKPSGRVLDKSTFVTSLRAAVASSSDGWTALDPRTQKKASVHMRAAEPLLDEYGIHNQKWRHISALKQYRGAILRDRTLIAPLTAPSPNDSSSTGDKSAMDSSTVLERVRRLAQEDERVWRRRAVEDDGVDAPGHVAEHARIRRIGSSCVCSTSFTAQRRYPDSEIERAREIDLALRAAEAGHAAALDAQQGDGS